jgi:ABC-2 type transport system ATP-binding protein
MNTLTASNSINSQKITPDGSPVIRFENVAVLYRVPRERVSGIKEYAVRWLQRRLSYEEFWALRDISFEVQRGEVFGVIGRNGAGKSTMLKVMARVLHPTLGRVVMRGKIAPLLELGAGFHPELTGRENVYLNSALLGHTRKQVDDLFPSILDFAEIGDFIDAPLRTYSTGMVARLGFSVATCMRPDILLVDEVLSVGDSRFQDKCLARMNSFQEQGTTIVIVSHSMQTIQNFCTRALWLEQGQPGAIGAVSEVINCYTG